MVLRNASGGARTYRISVDGVAQGTGGFEISVNSSSIGPVNDDIVSSQTLDAGNTANGTTVNATPESGEQAHAGSPAGRSVWYSVSIDPGQQGVFTFIPAGFDLRAAFYDRAFGGPPPATIASINASGSGGVETVNPSSAVRGG